MQAVEPSNHSSKDILVTEDRSIAGAYLRFFGTMFHLKSQRTPKLKRPQAQRRQTDSEITPNLQLLPDNYCSVPFHWVFLPCDDDDDDCNQVTVNHFTGQRINQSLNCANSKLRGDYYISLFFLTTLLDYLMDRH